MSEIITVFGATGNQGGSVVDAILNDPILSARFHIRAVTRDASKPAAKELEARGVEVVTADMSSLDSSLKNAVSDAHTVFLVTDFWQNMSRAAEVLHGKNVTDACKAAGVKHLIFSSLIDATAASKGALVHIYHFDGKAEIERYIRDSGVPATFILAGTFATQMHDLINRNGDDGYVLALPVNENSQIPLIDARRDVGLFVKAAIKNRTSLLGRQLYASAAYYTPQQIVDDFSAAIGKPATFVQIPEQVFKSFLPQETAQEVFETVMLFQDVGYYAGADLSESLNMLDEKPTEWKEYVRRNLNQWL